MNVFKSILFLAVATALQSCGEKDHATTFIIKNTLDTERSYETVELFKSDLKVEDVSSLGIKDVKTDELLVTQTVDNDGDGIMDKVLFQPKVAANSEKTFEIIPISEAERPIAPKYCYSRFVPERTDDYAWENDKVAFRVYGPTAQKMIEDKVPGGTLSSGVDAWLKRVDYPVINKWYKKYTDGTGTYHEDTGEGLDDFHVGISRGVGGIAVKKDSTYYTSKNYTDWKTITTGPIRTSFYLNYEDWDADGKKIIESRIISLDLGSNLSKFSISLEGTDSVSAGLTLHEKDGKVTENKNNGWVSYWQPHGDSELGTAIIGSENSFLGFEKFDTKVKDESNAYAHLRVIDNTITYYAGFGWKKSGQFENKEAWETYLDLFSEKIKSPLQVILQ